VINIQRLGCCKEMNPRCFHVDDRSKIAPAETADQNDLYGSCFQWLGGQNEAMHSFDLKRQRSELPIVIKDKNSSGDEIANVNFFYNIAHVEASAYAH